MKRKPYAYIGNYDESDDCMYAVNCKDKEEALEVMEKEFDLSNQQEEYIKPDFRSVEVDHFNNQFCIKCNLFCPDNICEECERNLQGKTYTIYRIELSLK